MDELFLDVLNEEVSLFDTCTHRSLIKAFLYVEGVEKNTTKKSDV
ncbi:hypothetical protein [Bacillus sp. FJAT-18017]|nr:hypothetical protein [Bacillus sp. FJAT-18017]